MIEQALEMAVHAHADQTDKAGRPYILHVLRVAMRVIAREPSVANDELFAIALLHDVVEDSTITVEDIASEFGDTIAAAVDALTRRENESYLQSYLPRLATNAAARLVKIADLQDNLDPMRPQTLPMENAERIVRYTTALSILKAKS
jgi:(p)ppGpp synthase/HD superfamily hydrolase